MIYVDYNTTYPLSPEYLPKHLNDVRHALAQIQGNPASEHRGGDAAKAALLDSRKSIATLLKAQPDEVIFCSGATEANNMAISGVIENHLRPHPEFLPEIVLTEGEHVSVRLPAEKWADLGFCKVKYAPLTSQGQVDVEKFFELLNPKTVFASVLHVNNETGAITPLEQIASQIRKNYPGIHFHSDGVQSIGKVSCEAIAQGFIDSYSFSSHKLGGYGGVGVLYLNAKKFLRPFILGGSQENRRRAGTENIPGIISLGLRAKEIQQNPHWISEAARLGALFKDELEKMESVVLHGENCLDTSANFHIEGVPLQTILTRFDEKEICAAAGCAFSATELKPSKTLLSMGYTQWVAGNSIRISFGPGNTSEEVEVLVSTIRKLARQAKPL